MKLCVDKVRNGSRICACLSVVHTYRPTYDHLFNLRQVQMYVVQYVIYCTHKKRGNWTTAWGLS